MAAPPAAVRGMTRLDRAAFAAALRVCALRLPAGNIAAVVRLVKPLTLRVPNVPPIQPARQLEAAAAADDLGGGARAGGAANGGTVDRGAAEAAANGGTVDGGAADTAVNGGTVDGGAADTAVEGGTVDGGAAEAAVNGGTVDGGAAEAAVESGAADRALSGDVVTGSADEGGVQEGVDKDGDGAGGVQEGVAKDDRMQDGVGNAKAANDSVSGDVAEESAGSDGTPEGVTKDSAEVAKDSAEKLPKILLLDPSQVTKESDLPWPALEKLGLTPAANFTRVPLRLGYDNYRADVILRAVLPEDQDGVAGFSRIGHLIHLNLKEHSLPYRAVIGAVLLDKHAGVRCVVNKVNTIDSTFRNFGMDVLAGDADFLVDARENGCSFRMDFSQVYWNPRLSTEHERLVAMLAPGDLLFDVFAGVGPFAVPAARKGCRVLANDLNPHSARWLRHNVDANRVAARVQTFCVDGRQFIRSEVRRGVREFLASGDNVGGARMHAVLNLPALAMQFVDAFVGLLAAEELAGVERVPLRVHVYTFTKELQAAEDSVRRALNDSLGRDVSEHVREVFMVRNVAPNKLMYRVSWDVPRDVLCAATGEPALKKVKLADE